MFTPYGKLMRINLTTRKIETQELGRKVLRSYIGGVGIGAWLLYQETDSTTDPLGPDNLLLALAGPFTGTGIPGSARHHIVARSPLTSIWGESNVGGSWAFQLKKAGISGVCISGSADTPVYLWIHNGQAEVRDAHALWGLDSYTAADILKQETSRQATVAVFGPAGEQCAGIASIPHIRRTVRAAARTGLGAVMGAKKLKAMVVLGDGPVPVARSAELKEQLRKCFKSIRQATAVFGKYGTAGSVENYELR